jgi:hypothetical protein
MTPQELLFKAHRLGIRARLGSGGELQLAPASKLTPKRLQAVQACKPQLVSLVGSLKKHGALDDPLILEALALFNATLQAPAGLSQTLIGSRRLTAHQAAFQWDAGQALTR